jgi:hypothetical protein
MIYDEGKYINIEKYANLPCGHFFEHVVSGLLDDLRWLLLDDHRGLWDDRRCLLLPRRRVPGRALLLGCCLLLSTAACTASWPLYAGLFLGLGGWFGYGDRNSKNCGSGDERPRHHEFARC